VTDEQIRLYAIARTVTPPETRIRTIAEKTSGGGTLYTLELKTPYGTLERWFAVHGSSLGPQISDQRLALELSAAIN
jgi:hypothetical protein